MNPRVPSPLSNLEQNGGNVDYVICIDKKDEEDEKKLPARKVEDPDCRRRAAIVEGVVRASLTTIDIDSSDITVSLQSELASAVWYCLTKLQQEKNGGCGAALNRAQGTGANQGSQPCKKRARHDTESISTTGPQSETSEMDDGIFGASGSVHHENQTSPMGLAFKQLQAQSNETNEAECQKTAMIKWFAQQLERTQSNFQALFEEQASAHRREMDALKASHEENVVHWKGKYERESLILKESKAEKVERIYLDKAISDYEAARKKIEPYLKALGEQNRERMRNFVAQEDALLRKMMIAIDDQLQIQQCNHFNERMSDRAALKEQHSVMELLRVKLNDVEKKLLEETNHSRQLQQLVDGHPSITSDARRKVHDRQDQPKREAAAKLAEQNRSELTKKDKEIRQLEARLKEIEKERAARHSEEEVKQRLHEKAVEYDATLSNLVRCHLRDMRGKDIRLEGLADCIKKLSTENRIYRERIEMLEKTSQPSTQAGQRRSRRSGSSNNRNSKKSPPSVTPATEPKK